MIEKFVNALRPSGYIVTMAAQADKDRAPQRYDIPRMAASLDHINLMTYDYHGYWDSLTGFNTPLYSADTSDIYTIDQSVKFWVSQVGDSRKHKINLGLAFYGRVWQLNSTSSPVPGQAGFKPADSPYGVYTYAEICGFTNNQGWSKIYDNTSRSFYAHNNIRWVSYDTRESHREKINYLNSMGLGGVKLWNIGDDDLGEFFIR
jgi:chitinase